MLKHTDPRTVRGRSTQNDSVCNERIFRNGSFKIAKESNDLADLVKVLPESYQKSNEFSVNRNCGQNVAADDKRTFTDKEKVRRVQTPGNDNKDAMLDCESGFYQSEDKRNCHKLRSSYVTSTAYICYIFAQTEYIIRCYFSLCFISFVAFICILYSHVVQACLFRLK